MNPKTLVFGLSLEVPVRTACRLCLGGRNEPKLIGAPLPSCSDCTAGTRKIPACETGFSSPRNQPPTLCLRSVRPDERRLFLVKRQKQGLPCHRSPSRGDLEVLLPESRECNSPALCFISPGVEGVGFRHGVRLSDNC
jgi:hypothetical protein